MIIVQCQEEEKLRKEVNKNLPKITTELKAHTEAYLKKYGKEFLIKDMTFSDLNDYQESQHEIEKQHELERKKTEKKKLLEKESIYGSDKTPISRKNMTLRAKNKTIRTPTVKRLQHDSSKIGNFNKTPKPAGTRKALGERNETFVSGSNMAKASIASVTDNIFNNADVASSTLKPEQFVCRL